MSRALFSLESRVALVTGAASGFGAHFASVLAAAGANVVCCARRQERITAVAAGICEQGGNALAVPMDVTNRQSVEAAFAAAREQYGPVDILVNNAGQSAPAPFDAMSDEQWDSVINVNLKGLWQVSQVCARQLIEAGRAGSIINIASILGVVARPGFSNYATSKAAVIHLTRNMALDLIQHRIRVNAMAPGFFRTEMTEWWFETEEGKREAAALPPARLGEMHELDGPLLLLASEASSYMSGSVITVDAAHSARIS